MLIAELKNLMKDSLQPRHVQHLSSTEYSKPLSSVEGGERRAFTPCWLVRWEPHPLSPAPSRTQVDVNMDVCHASSCASSALCKLLLWFALGAGGLQQLLDQSSPQLPTRKKKEGWHLGKRQRLRLGWLAERTRSHPPDGYHTRKREGCLTGNEEKKVTLRVSRHDPLRSFAP